MNKVDLIVIGAGAAGLMAAAHAAELGLHVLLLEAGAEAGQKLLLTGGGRCNLSNFQATADHGDHYFGYARFLHPSFQRLSPHDLRQYFHEHDFPLVIEDGCRLYPAHGGALAVRNFFLDRLRENGARLQCRRKVDAIQATEEGFLIYCNKEKHLCSRLLITCGGASFPHCGSDGTALKLIQDLGIQTEKFTPALAALTLQDPPGKEYSGIVLEKVCLFLKWPSKKIRKAPYHEQDGDVLLTPFGISGTPVLNISRYFDREASPELYLNLLPKLKEFEVEEYLLKLCQSSAKSQLKNLNWPVLPQRLRQVFLDKIAVPSELVAAHLSSEQLRRLVQGYTALPLRVNHSRGLRSAFCSRGGVLLDQVNPRSLESKVLPGLYFAGEILNIDGECGGFNLQAAFATAVLAAESIAKSLAENLS